MLPVCMTYIILIEVLSFERSNMTALMIANSEVFTVCSHCSKSFTCVNSQNPHQGWVPLLSLFYRWGNWGSERLRTCLRSQRQEVGWDLNLGLWLKRLFHYPWPTLHSLSSPLCAPNQSCWMGFTSFWRDCQELCAERDLKTLHPGPKRTPC